LVAKTTTYNDKMSRKNLLK